MTDSYYPKHSREHLAVIREQPFPSHDIPRLTREVEGLREENERLRLETLTLTSKVTHLLAVLKETQAHLRLGHTVTADDLIEDTLKEFKP
jgi:hypothetical protein